MATIFVKNVCDTLSDNMKLTLVNAETNAALNLEEENVFQPMISFFCIFFMAVIL